MSEPAGATATVPPQRRRTHADGYRAFMIIWAAQLVARVGNGLTAFGLAVHVYTLRDENQFMATDFRLGGDPHARGDAVAEARAFLDAGVDGIFTDHAGTVVECYAQNGKAVEFGQRLFRIKRA